ncbi:MAG TPA: hypothetical protein VNJ70_17890 [Thermoanaerobaculia bacterium]|nr:hypothetical protein [Thermoanaerobaculia bacterium]
MAATTLRRRRDRAYGVTASVPVYLGFLAHPAPDDTLITAALYGADGAWLSDYLVGDCGTQQTRDGLAVGTWGSPASAVDPAAGALVGHDIVSGDIYTWNLATNTIHEFNGKVLGEMFAAIADGAEVWWFRLSADLFPDLEGGQVFQYTWQLFGDPWSLFPHVKFQELQRGAEAYPPGKNWVEPVLDPERFGAWLTPEAFYCRVPLRFRIEEDPDDPTAVVKDVIVRAPRELEVFPATSTTETILDPPADDFALAGVGIPRPGTTQALAFVTAGAPAATLHALDDEGESSVVWPSDGGWDLGGSTPISHNVSRSGAEGCLYTDLSEVRRGPLQDVGADPTAAPAIAVHPVLGVKPTCLFLIA